MQRRRAVSRKQNRRVHALITLIFCIAVFILVCAGCFLLVKTDGTITNKPNQSQGDSSSAAPDGADSTTDGDSQQEQPTMTEEEQRIADATSTASANCTKDAPQVVDPALWDERGKRRRGRYPGWAYVPSDNPAGKLWWDRRTGHRHSTTYNNPR